MSDDKYVIVTCGNICGKLLQDRFICPGIHQECIEVNDQVVTPKMFSVMGDKEKLKDWKNAIRINGVSIRKMMDSGELEFHNHTEQCTGRCISRNTGVSKYDITKFENEMDLPTFVPLVTAVSCMSADHGLAMLRDVAAEAGSGQPVFPEPTPFSMAEALSKATEIESVLNSVSLKKDSCGIKELSSIVPLLTAGTTGSSMGSVTAVPSQSVFPTAMPVALEPVSPEEVTVKQEPSSSLEEQEQHNGAEEQSTNGFQCKGSHPAFQSEAALPLNGDTDIIEDSRTFWQGILEVGLMDEFIREIKNALDVLKNDLIKGRASQDDACRLSRVVTELGLTTKLKWKMAARKTETEVQKSRLLEEIESLKKRVAVSEKKERELKRKADCFDQLLELGRPKRTPTSTPNSSLSEDCPSPSAHMDEENGVGNEPDSDADKCNSSSAAREEDSTQVGSHAVKEADTITCKKQRPDTDSQGIPVASMDKTPGGIAAVESDDSRNVKHTHSKKDTGDTS